MLIEWYSVTVDFLMDTLLSSFASQVLWILKWESLTNSIKYRASV